MKNISNKFRSRLYSAMKVFIAMATLALCASSTAKATPVTIVNPSFETGDITGYGSTTASGYGATLTVNQSTGSGYYEPYTDPLPSPGDGDSYLHMKGNSQVGNQPITDVFQDVGVLQPYTTYTLTVAIGAGRFHYNNSGFLSLLNGTNDTGATLNSTTLSGFYMYNRPESAQFTDYTVSYTTGAVVSGDLTFELATNSGYGDGNNDNGRNFDNVRLDATSVAAAPEPSSYAMLSAGLVVLGLIARRRTLNS